MSRTSRWALRSSALALGLVVTSLFSAAQAASINYGDFGPISGTTFAGVTESSSDPLPLYGPPTLFPVGLDFDPLAFDAVAVDSNPGDIDSVDGQLNFTVKNAAGVSGVSLFERGDYSLTGVGTANTKVDAGVNMILTITEINGSLVAPISLPAVVGSISANLAANPGPGQPWSIGLFSPVNLPAGQKATAVKVAIDNILSANSEQLSSARISKKEFIITTDKPIPEPATMVLAGMGLCGMALVARRKRS